MTLDLRAIRELCEKATPGPWVNGQPQADEDASIYVAGTEQYVIAGCGCCGSPFGTPADATFIATARTAIPQLLALVEELQAKNAELTRHFQSINQAERLDHISTIGEVQKANEKLAEAMKLVEELQAARDEACDLAEARLPERCDHDSDYKRFGAETCGNLMPCKSHPRSGAWARIAQLRAIGQRAEGGAK